MIHENIKIDIDYEKLGIKHKGADAVFTTYIKEMYPEYQNVFERPLVIICPGGGYEHHSPREGEALCRMNSHVHYMKQHIQLIM